MKKPLTIPVGSGWVSPKGRTYFAISIPKLPKPGYTFRLVVEIHRWRKR